MGGGISCGNRSTSRGFHHLDRDVSFKVDQVVRGGAVSHLDGMSSILTAGVLVVHAVVILSVMRNVEIILRVGVISNVNGDRAQLGAQVVYIIGQSAVVPVVDLCSICADGTGINIVHGDVVVADLVVRLSVAAAGNEQTGVCIIEVNFAENVVIQGILRNILMSNKGIGEGALNVLLVGSVKLVVLIQTNVEHTGLQICFELRSITSRIMLYRPFTSLVTGKNTNVVLVNNEQDDVRTSVGIKQDSVVTCLLRGLEAVVRILVTDEHVEITGSRLKGVRCAKRTVSRSSDREERIVSGRFVGQNSAHAFVGRNSTSRSI